MLRFILPVGLFAGLVVFFLVGLGRDPGYVPSPLIGKPLPQFTLPRLDDPSRTLAHAELLGQVSVLNVWATWCVGCRQEHEALMQIAATAEVPIYGLNWKDDPEMARRWLVQLGDPYVATAMDLDGRVAIDWGVYGAPETFLIGADGTVLYKHIAPITLEIWREEFLPRIRQARSGRS
jgi:cytochrome c biogenesis protein CcmG/thiol:disulfide interchange protein DsbE